MLLDGFGNDIYIAKRSSQAYSEFIFNSLLIDLSGNDIYNASIWSQAVALGWPNPFICASTQAIMLDIGGNDAYNGGDMGCGGGGIALLINIFGRDKYNGIEKDWSIWTQGCFGVGIDIGGI